MPRFPYNKIPSINLLLAFESVARNKSFKLAAAELNVSPPSITQKIARLESLLNCQLFTRSSKGVIATDIGRHYYAEVVNGLDSLSSVCSPSIKPEINKLLLSAPPFLAHRYIVAHLYELKEILPSVNLSLISELRVSDLKAGEADVAIRFGMGDWPELEALPFLPISVTPVCSPDYAKKNNINHLDDLRSDCLLHLDVNTRGWKAFFSEFNIHGVSSKNEIHFNDYTSMIQSCQNHAGIALGIRASVDALLESKALVAPLSETLSFQESYHYVFSKTHPHADIIKTLYRWLLSKLPEKKTSN